MITLNLPEKIETIDQAKTFLKLLHDAGLMYHCEDDATDCLEGKVAYFTACEINKLMNMIYDLPGNDGCLNMAFDPCGYALELINN